MSGQPQIPGVINFDVSHVAVTREGAPGDQFVPEITILDRGDSFDLTIRFTGSGFVWNWLKTLGATYKVEAHAEGYGNTAGEYNLGSVTGALNPANNTYNVVLPVSGATINRNGVYMIAAMVTFDPPLNGLLGFVEGLKIMVHELEE